MTSTKKISPINLSLQSTPAQDINAERAEQDLLSTLLRSPMEIDIDALAGIGTEDSITIRSLRGNTAALTIQKTGENNIKLGFSVAGKTASGGALRVNYDDKEVILSADGEGYTVPLKNSELPALLKARLKQVSKVGPREVGNKIAEAV